MEITVKKVKYEIPDSLKDMYGDTSDAYAEGQKIPAVIAGDEITVFGALKMKRQ